MIVPPPGSPGVTLAEEASGGGIKIVQMSWHGRTLRTVAAEKDGN
jgi:hypothetical protein